MISDIFQSPIVIAMDEKDYSFEFDHAAYAALEKQINKSIYEIYDDFLIGKHPEFSDFPAIVHCAMLKHHSKEEIEKMKNCLKEYPWMWKRLEQPVAIAFIQPLTPPKSMENILGSVKKKTQEQQNLALETKNTIG